MAYPFNLICNMTMNFYLLTLAPRVMMVCGQKKTIFKKKEKKESILRILPLINHMLIVYIKPIHVLKSLAYDWYPCADPGIFVRGGQGQSNKKALTTFFFFFFFYFVLSLFYRSQMVNFKEIYHFSRFKRGSNIFQGVQLFPGRSNS